MLLVEYNVLDDIKVIRESTGSGSKRLLMRGKFQKCDEQNNNGRIYPKSVLESQVKGIQGKINERSLVGALDHPANDAIHLSQASHVITKLWLEKNGDVMGECEILSTPNGKIVEALLNDGVKIGISSRGIGSVSEGMKGKVVNEDFKLITFDLVSDPSTKGAFPELSESMRENSERAQAIVSKHKKQRVLLTMLESKIDEALRAGSENSRTISGKGSPANARTDTPDAHIVHPDGKVSRNPASDEYMRKNFKNYRGLGGSGKSKRSDSSYDLSKFGDALLEALKGMFENNMGLDRSFRGRERGHGEDGKFSNPFAAEIQAKADAKEKAKADAAAKLKRQKAPQGQPKTSP